MYTVIFDFRLSSKFLGLFWFRLEVIETDFLQAGCIYCQQTESQFQTTDV